MKELFRTMAASHKILILGFGKEGQSTWRFIKKNYPEMTVGIADKDADLLQRTEDQEELAGIDLYLGEKYLDALNDYSLVIKSPGVGLPENLSLRPGIVITSQTRLMLEAYHRQIIGITGTKGKSTTSSLVHHLLANAGVSSVLVGNIGLPPFDYLDRIGPDTKVVYEMSSHQLEDIGIAPHIAVLLNLFPEHLDRYPSLESYYGAKMRILTEQQASDIFIYNDDIPGISEQIAPYEPVRRFLRFSANHHSGQGCYLQDNGIYMCNEKGSTLFAEITDDDYFLKGGHNRMNMMAAILAAIAAGAGSEAIRAGLKTFKGLEHRLEYAGTYRDILFYNDSIATIPEAAIAAVKALPDTDTLILGGFDRGLDYSGLVDFMVRSDVRNFIFLGKAGERIYKDFQTIENNKNLFYVASFEEAFQIIFRVTNAGKICLLSPAAASYDIFRNFEERGKIFKKIARSY